MTLFVALVRLVLAVVFVTSAVAKLRDRSDSREAVRAFGVPSALVPLVSTGLPWVEMGCALLLLLPDPAGAVGAAASVVLLLVFTVAIVANLVRGHRPECRCFGAMSGSEGVSWKSVTRNGVLIVLGVLGLLQLDNPGIIGALAGLAPDARWTTIAVVLLAATVVGLAAALWTLMGRYGAVLTRLEVVERMAGLAEPLPAPEFALDDLDGNRVALEDSLAAGRPAMLVFVASNCSHCTELMPDLAAWQNDPDHPMTVVVIAEGSSQDLREKAAVAGGPLRILLQQGHEVSDAYDVSGTPAAVMVGVDGLLAAPPALGIDPVREQHDRLARAMRSASQDTTHEHVHQSGQPVHDIGMRVAQRGEVPSPERRLQSEDGTEVTIAGLAEDRAVLLFWRTDCGFCRGILDEVVRLQEFVPLYLVSPSETDSIRVDGLTAPVLRDPAGRVEQWLGVPGTPSAARFTDGELVDVAVGGPDVLALMETAGRIVTR
jgi:thiol-disulfide isomerase/thioredoxin/uncharacterized membrane protein YphA (DoxX/SURF4 family)